MAEFQRNTGAEVDGIVGLDTIDALDRLHPCGGPSRVVVRETEAVLRPAGTGRGAASPSILVTVPAIQGAFSPDGLTEAEACVLLATDLAIELQARGAEPTILRSADENPDAE